MKFFGSILKFSYWVLIRHSSRRCQIQLHFLLFHYFSQLINWIEHLIVFLLHNSYELVLRAFIRLLHSLNLSQECFSWLLKALYLHLLVLIVEVLISVYLLKGFDLPPYSCLVFSSCSLYVRYSFVNFVENGKFLIPPKNCILQLFHLRLNLEEDSLHLS